LENIYKIKNKKSYEEDTIQRLQARLIHTRILVECEFWLLVVECFEGGVTDDETKGEVDLSLEKDL
jgi:hypothetical protein